MSSESHRSRKDTPFWEQTLALLKYYYESARADPTSGAFRDLEEVQRLLQLHYDDERLTAIRNRIECATNVKAAVQELLRNVVGEERAANVIASFPTEVTIIEETGTHIVDDTRES